MFWVSVPTDNLLRFPELVVRVCGWLLCLTFPGHGTTVFVKRFRSRLGRQKQIQYMLSPTTKKIPEISTR